MSLTNLTGLPVPKNTGPEATAYTFANRGAATVPCNDPLTACQFLELARLDHITNVTAKVGRNWIPVRMELIPHGSDTHKGRRFDSYTAMFKDHNGRYVGRLGFGQYRDGR
jgi:hypothetical protein